MIMSKGMLQVESSKAQELALSLSKCGKVADSDSEGDIDRDSVMPLEPESLNT